MDPAVVLDPGNTLAACYKARDFRRYSQYGTFREIETLGMTPVRIWLDRTDRSELDWQTGATASMIRSGVIGRPR